MLPTEFMAHIFFFHHDLCRGGDPADRPYAPPITSHPTKITAQFTKNRRHIWWRHRIWRPFLLESLRAACFDVPFNLFINNSLSTFHFCRQKLASFLTYRTINDLIFEGQTKDGAVMILVKICVEILPDKRKEFEQAVQWLVKSHTEEKGGISKSIYREIEDSNRFYYLEEWDNLQNFEAHFQSDAFRALIGGMKTLGKIINAKKVSGVQEEDLDI